MATTIEQQVALDEALVPSTKRLRIGRSNFKLPLDIQSKEPTLQVAYDVLRGCPFFMAFLNIVDLEAFKEMLHISPRVPGQSFDEPPFEEELLDFLRFLGHSAQIKTLTDVNVNKLFQPWRSFAAVINRDDILFSTIKVVSRHQNTQQYGAILTIELTTEDIRNTKAYIEYYACATGEAAPKPKASARRKRGDSDSSTTPPAVASPRPITNVVAALRLTAAAKGKQSARATSPYDPLEVERTEAEQLKIVLRRSRHEMHISQHGGSSTDEGTGFKPGVSDVPSDDSEEEISWNSSDDEDVNAQDKGRDDDEGEKNDKSDAGKDDDDDDQDDAERDDDDDDDGNEEEIAKLDEQEDTESGEGDAEETESDEESAEEETREEEEESFDLIPRTPKDNEDDGNGKEDQGLSVSEKQRLIEEEEADELYRDTTQFAKAVSNIPGIVHQYMTQQMTKAIREAVQIQTDRLQDSFQRENDVFLRTIDENMKRIIKGQALVDAYEEDKTILESYGDTAILKRRRGDDDDQEGPSARSYWGSKRRREGGKPESASTPSEPATKSASKSTTETQSRQMSASDSAFAEEPVQTTCQMDEPPHLVFETGAEDQPIVQTFQHPEWFSQPRKPLTPDRDWNKTLSAVQGSAQTWISKLAKQADSRSSFNELLDTPIDFSNFIMNRFCVYTLTPELLAGPTYELIRGSCTSLTEIEYHLEEPLPLIPDNRGHRVIPFPHFINNDLVYLQGGASSQKYTTSVTKTKAADYGHIKWIEDLVPRTMESALDVYSKRRIIAVTDLRIVEWHNYKHLDWISVRRDDDKIYKFKEGDFKRLRLQDIEDMLLLLVQEKLSNLIVEEHFAFNVSLRMFTRSIVIQRRVEDL
nr:hypothetical protein [Tanacetum cinerariifolium]